MKLALQADSSGLHSSNITNMLKDNFNTHQRNDCALLADNITSIILWHLGGCVNVDDRLNYPTVKKIRVTLHEGP